jgi:hypothetical protein
LSMIYMYVVSSDHLLALERILLDNNPTTPVNIGNSE